jgi:N-acetylglucosaminyl-diphospho-decaprenol L-rhamnosyltransferase
MLLNPDTELRAEALDALVQFMEGHPQAGLATARLVERDGTPQLCAQPVPSLLRVLLEASRLHKCLPAPIRGRLLLSTYWSYDQAVRLGWTWGTALIARREAVLQAGCLCEEFFMYGEDVEWCLRMRRHGWEVWFCPEAEVLHLGGQSAAQRWDDAGRRRAVWDAYYMAVRRHRSAGYVWMLQAATAAALGANCLATRFDRRDASKSFSDALAYHLRSLRRVSSR